MKIMIVDDDESIGQLLALMLKSAGFADPVQVLSAIRALEMLERDGVASGIDLILMDYMMPGLDGIGAIQRIRALPEVADVPIIMVTSRNQPEDLQEAFEAGANDFIVKPVNRLELFARVRSALRLKQEMDRRKAREQELLEVTRKLREANQRLERLTLLDGLTGIPNRRLFEKRLMQEWSTGLTHQAPLALLMGDIDSFKLYNDSLGHLAGDDCLKQVAKALAREVHRKGDLVTRYGGEEFAVILPDTSLAGARLVGEKMRATVELLGIAHPAAKRGKIITISFGAASLIPEPMKTPLVLIEQADQALYIAKRGGGNRVETLMGEFEVS